MITAIPKTAAVLATLFVLELGLARTQSPTHAATPREQFVAFCKDKHRKFAERLSSGGTADELVLRFYGAGDIGGGFHEVTFKEFEKRCKTHGFTSRLTRGMIDRWLTGDLQVSEPDLSTIKVTNKRYRFVLTPVGEAPSYRIESMDLQRRNLPKMHFEACGLAIAFALFNSGRTFLEVANDPESNILSWQEGVVNGNEVFRVDFNFFYYYPSSGERKRSRYAAFFDKQKGHCLQILYGDPEGEFYAKRVIQYADLDSRVPHVSKILGHDKIDGDWVVKRGRAYRHVAFDRDVDEAVFTAAHYGIPEPFPTRSPRRWIFFVIMGGILILCGWALRRFWQHQRSTPDS